MSRWLRSFFVSLGLFVCSCAAGPASRYDPNLSAQLQSMNIALDSETPSTLRRVLDQAEFLQRLAPSDPRVSDLLGCIYFRMGDLRSARRFFEEALRLDPAYARAMTNLGILELASGNLEEASRRFEEALASNPAEYLAYRYSADVADRVGDMARARQNRAIFQMLAPGR